VTPARELNPLPDGTATPVVVRLYALEDPARFRQAGFFALYDDAEASLGGDLIATTEVTVRPGEPVSRDWPLAPGVGYVGALAAFRDIDRADWRDVLALSAAAADGGTVPVEVAVEARTITLSTP
ncbi:MAG: type VI secretion system lipoprotein TssJ, partial [Alphaproteobacteria bacterium]|jgi:type VI secretion system protein VasD|nr:type VI secretion system lipoprotein TssJ [Alphaproteobacteria bacterium]